MNGLLQVALAALVSAGGVGGILTYLNARKVTKIDYMETVAQTLTGEYTRVNKELTELRAQYRQIERELEASLIRTREVERELASERERSARLEARVAVLEGQG